MSIDPMKLLRADVKRLGTQGALALHIGISDAYLSDVLNGRRGFGPAILDHYGLVVKYGRRSENRDDK